MGIQITWIKAQMDTISEMTLKRIKEQRKWRVPGEEGWDAECVILGYSSALTAKEPFGSWASWSRYKASVLRGF